MRDDEASEAKRLAKRLHDVEHCPKCGRALDLKEKSPCREVRTCKCGWFYVTEGMQA